MTTLLAIGFLIALSVATLLAHNRANDITDYYGPNFVQGYGHKSWPWSIGFALLGVFLSADIISGWGVRTAHYPDLIAISWLIIVMFEFGIIGHWAWFEKFHRGVIKSAAQSQFQQGISGHEEARAEPSFSDFGQAAENDGDFAFDPSAFEFEKPQSQRSTSSEVLGSSALRSAPRGFDQRHSKDEKLWAVVDDPSATDHERQAAFAKILKAQNSRAGKTGRDIARA